MDANTASPRGSGTFLVGVMLVGAGLVYGGAWTLLVLLGEIVLMGTGGPHTDESQVPFGTILTGLATLGMIVAGVLLIIASRPGTTGRGLATTGFWMVAGAAAAYVFGFVLCVSGH